jgi:hypothetical protein
MMLFEIRNYYKDPDQIEEFKEWVAWVKAEAIPYFSQKLDIVGFWVNTNDEPVIIGAPMDKFGSASVTWIIKWRDMAHRKEVQPGVVASSECQEIFSREPGGREGYLRKEVKFAESLM